MPSKGFETNYDRPTGILMDLPTPTLLLPTTIPFTCLTLARLLLLTTFSSPLVTFSLPRRVPSTTSGPHQSKSVPTTALLSFSATAVSTALVTTTAGLSTALRTVLTIGAILLLLLSGVTGLVSVLIFTPSRRLSRCTAAQDRRVRNLRATKYSTKLTFTR